MDLPEPSPFAAFRRHVRAKVHVLLDLAPHAQAPDSRGRSKAMSQVPRAAENSRSGRGRPPIGGSRIICRGAKRGGGQGLGAHIAARASAHVRPG